MQQSITSHQHTLHFLPRLDQPEEKTRDVAKQIQKALGSQDQHSARFHLLIGSRVPEKIIHAHLADIRADGARNPGALLTYRMTRYATERLGEGQLSLRERIEQLTARKRVP